MADNITSWNSPYQTEKFSIGIKNAGFETAKAEDCDGNAIYYYGNNDNLIAWEVSSKIDLNTAKPPTNSKIYQFDGNITQYDIGNYSEDYFTIALEDRANRFNKRFMRNVNSIKNNETLILEEASTFSDVDLALKKFIPYPERRDGIDIDRYSRIIHSLAEVGIMQCFILRDLTTNSIHGASMVLLSDSQANLRWYSADREKNYGHLLHYLVINRLFNECSKNIVDQSGISSSVTSNNKMAGIDSFKNQTGGSLIRFKLISDKEK